jgi:hypothetical protein
MKRNIAATAYLIVLGGVFVAIKSQDLPFGVQIVTDIETHANQIEELAKIAIELHNWESLLTTLGNETMTLDGVTRLGFYGATQPYYQAQVNDITGETFGWNEILGATLGVPTIGPAWGTTTIPIVPTPPMIGLPSTDPLMILLSGAEIRDGLAQNALLTSVNIRAQQAMNNGVILNLQTTCFGDNFLTADIQHNCTTAAGVLGTQQTQVANGILAAQLDLNFVDAMDKRNAQVKQVNAAGQELMFGLTRSEPIFDANAMDATLLRF